MPRLGAATSSLLSFFSSFPLFFFFLLDLCSISLVLSFSPLLNIQHTHLQSLDKNESIMKDLPVDDEIGFLLSVLSNLRWLDVVRCLDVTS